MSMFNMGGVKNVQVVSNNFLSAGIHNVIFKGLNKANHCNAIELHFEAVDGSGVHNEYIFEPNSDERKQGTYGINPSDAENFMCKIKQIIDALDPELARKIEANGDNFTAPDFDGFINILKKYLDKKVGVQTQIKLIPANGNFVRFPGYVARLNKDNVIYMTTKFIGDNLVLTAREKDAIDNVSQAKPTDMSKRKNELDDIREDFDDINIEDNNDGLPF